MNPRINFFDERTYISMSKITSTAKSLLQRAAKQLGYRIVPKDRDPYTLLKHIEDKQFSSVIDVGANNGTTCLHWLHTFPIAHVYAIEAQTAYLPELNSIKNRHPKRITIWNCAASDQDEEIEFHIHENHPSSSSLLQSTSHSHSLLPFTKGTRIEKVHATRLDQLLAANKVTLSTDTLLKLDVQGAELKVLKGGSETLKSVSHILCEVNLQSLYEGQASFIDILLYLQDKSFQLVGFSEQFHNHSGEAIYFDAIFSKVPSQTPMLQN